MLKGYCSLNILPPLEGEDIVLTLPVWGPTSFGNDVQNQGRIQDLPKGVDRGERVECEPITHNFIHQKMVDNVQKLN